MSTPPAIPLTEASSTEDNTRSIPKAVFIDNTEAWVDKYTADELIG